MSLPVLQMSELFTSGSTTALPNQVTVPVVPRTFGSLFSYPSNWRDVLPAAVTPCATGALALRTEIWLQSQSTSTVIAGGKFTVNIVAKDRAGTVLGTVRFRHTVPSSIASGTIYPVEILELTGFTTQEVIGGGFEYKWGAVYSSSFGTRFQISMRTGALLAKLPYEATLTVTWVNEIPNTQLAPDTRLVYTNQRAVPYVNGGPSAPFPHVQIAYTNQNLPGTGQEFNNSLLEAEIWFREFTDQADGAGWVKRGVFPATTPTGGTPTVALSAKVLRTRLFATLMLSRDVLGGEALSYSTTTNFPYTTGAVVPRPDGGLARFANSFGSDGVSLGLNFPVAKIKSAFSSAWREESGDFSMVVRETSGAWTLMRFSRKDCVPTSPEYALLPTLALMFNDPDILWVHACKTPDGGAVAVALRHKLETVNGSISPTATRQWLFKRSPDRVTWPPDSAAVVAHTPGFNDLRPPMIEYQDGSLIIYNGSVTRTSMALGVDQSWS